MVQVRAVSVNRGELHRLDRSRPGWRPGWDFSGEVVHTGSGSTLRPGTAVFGILLGGSWAEQITVPTHQLAPLPDAVSWTTAAALPTAGLTALRILGLYEGLQRSSVLVTGAAGGVGRYAVQLAHRAGARVTAVVGRPERARGLETLGAHQVSIGMPRSGTEFDLILESVGGDSLGRALDLVAPDGLVISFGNSSRATTCFPGSDFYPKQAVLRGFFLLDDLVAHPPADDLTELIGLVDSGELDVDIAAVADWRDAAAVLRALRERRLAGKAVLQVPARRSAHGMAGRGNG